MTYAVSNLFNPLNRIPHNSTNLEKTGVFELEHQKYISKMARDLLVVTFDWIMLEIWQKEVTRMVQTVINYCNQISVKKKNP